MTGRGWRYSFAEVRSATRHYNFFHDLCVWPSEPLSWLLANSSRISPNAVTLIAIIAGLSASLLFWNALWVLAALGFALFFLLDCCDGTLARLTGRCSQKGAALDLYGDRLVLFAACVSRVAWHQQQGAATAVWLSAAYLAAHSMTDVGWILGLQRQQDRPPQWPALKHALREKAASPASGRRAILSSLSRLEQYLRPAPWFCNILFLLGGCLLPASQIQVYEAALAALVWWLIAGSLRQLARNLTVRRP